MNVIHENTSVSSEVNTFRLGFRLMDVTSFVTFKIDRKYM